MRSRSSMLVMLMAVTLAASACQSTNQRGSTTAIDDTILTDESTLDPGDPSGARGTAGGPRQSGTSSDPATGPTTGASTAPGSGSQARPGAQRPNGGPGGANDPTTPTGPGSPGTGTGSDNDDVAMGRGVTAETITIGFQAGETGAAFAAVGAALQPAYEGDMARALVDWLNATGGIRGREVRGVYHETETTQGTWASQAQQTCSVMTEDNEVFAVVSSAVGGDNSLAACLAEKQTPLIERNTWVWDQPQFDQFPDVYRPGHPRAEDGYREYLQGLFNNGFFDGATVGLLHFDAPVFQRIMDGVVRPKLSELGIDVVEQEISSPRGVGDFGGSGAQMGAAVLRFRGEGVTHVIMVENAGIMPFFFMKEAESQGFRPRYGLSSIDIPDTQASQNDAVQLEDALAIGWAPGIDAGDGDMAPEYETAEYLLCRQILSDAGIENIAAFYAQSMCDAMFMLRSALEAAPSLTREGLRAGVAALGTSHRSPFTIRATYGPGKRWGASTVRPLQYVLDCECFRHIGTERRFA